MQFKYQIGDYVKYHGCETMDDIRLGTWKENVIKTGRIVRIHPENRKCYEINPSFEKYQITERIPEHSIIGIQRQF